MGDCNAWLSTRDEISLKSFSVRSASSRNTLLNGASSAESCAAFLRATRTPNWSQKSKIRVGPQDGDLLLIHLGDVLNLAAKHAELPQHHSIT
jgi:hypothetical protein